VKCGIPKELIPLFFKKHLGLDDSHSTTLYSHQVE